MENNKNWILDVPEYIAEWLTTRRNNALGKRNLSNEKLSEKIQDYSAFLIYTFVDPVYFLWASGSFHRDRTNILFLSPRYYFVGQGFPILNLLNPLPELLGILKGGEKKSQYERINAGLIYILQGVLWNGEDKLIDKDNFNEFVESYIDTMRNNKSHEGRPFPTIMFEWSDENYVFRAKHAPFMKEYKGKVKSLKMYDINMRLYPLMMMDAVLRYIEELKSAHPKSQIVIDFIRYYNKESLIRKQVKLIRKTVSNIRKGEWDDSYDNLNQYFEYLISNRNIDNN